MPSYNFELLPRERGSDNTDPRTRIESECERGTNIKLLLPVDALVQNEVYKTAKDLKEINSSRSDHISCKARFADAKSENENILPGSQGEVKLVASKSKVTFIDSVEKSAFSLVSKNKSESSHDPEDHMMESVVVECLHGDLMAEAEE
ncbi:hypothetical protein PROFUN_11899 [Planoprotostelium fungivorum]|uniref:Uncharacterized protein n=1 Tax=Planoprotostelium fungivorum TaxID=1890364 RepID=A0A2P6N913_9EUKA|nr:hypothetical protein PROFUN_11899 [Planoprotostelium fungivorum]